MSTQDLALPMQNGAEQLLYADTYSLPDGDYSSMQLEQDVNATLTSLPQSSDAFPSYVEPLDEVFWDTTMQQLNFMESEVQPVKRIDSGLNARAKVFTPSQGLWVQQQQQQPQQTFTPATGVPSSSIPRSFPQQLTRIQTNFESWSQAPYSAPAYYNDPYNQPSVSPLVTITDETQGCSQGIQWRSDLAPPEAIDLWATASSYHPGGQLAVDYDNNMLTPTSPNPSVRSRSRSSSIASAATYLCDFPNCNKSFTVKTEFSHHRRNHGPRNHKCPCCEKRFIFKKDMARHKKIHSDSRDWFCVHDGCEWARKGFQRKDHYTRHMKTHEPRSSGILTPVTSSATLSRSPSRH